MNSINPKKPLILIVPDRETSEGNEVFSIRCDYLDAIEKAGGIPIVSSYRPSSWRGLDKMVSGVLITGGGFDIHPRHYREKPITGLGRIKPDRTKCETEVIQWALSRDLPVLGICGGMQLINVVFGGNLYQDLPRQFPSARLHVKKGSGKRKHPVLVKKESRLFGIMKKRMLTVNSTHHQAVRLVGKGLFGCAHSSDGVIEAVESISHPFVIGVQWHPERLFHIPAQRRIFSEFIRAVQHRSLHFQSPTKKRRKA